MCVCEGGGAMLDLSSTKTILLGVAQEGAVTSQVILIFMSVSSAQKLKLFFVWV